ncbi:MAG: ubiquinol-cytochrome c reductase iron-sulfur subunit [Desulfovibrio sp.]|nr:ubiquinol-cytochrome c reductase iron-sulfur subunit [Desulfovibrio sp.]
MELPEANETLSRRRFFVNGIKVVAGLLGLGLGIPLVGFFIAPALKKEQHDWIAIADLNLMNAGEPAKVTYQYTRRDGWKTAETRKTAFVVKHADGKITALTNKCTHLGCGVEWNASSKQFTCPCHGGVFDIQGNVTAGPPPKPLTRLMVKVEVNKIFIKDAQQ